MLWQVYNTYCPLILEELLANRYEDANKLTYVIGIIMAMDNLAALILMPIFGVLSDKTKTKKGKRMPYILIGMLASALLFSFNRYFLFVKFFNGCHFINDACVNHYARISFSCSCFNA